MSKPHSLHAASFVLSAPKCDRHFHKSLCPGAIHGQECPETGLGNAAYQHDRFRQELLGAGAAVLTVPYVHGAMESVFAKDNALLATTPRGPIALLARSRVAERQIEQAPRQAALESLGFDIHGRTDSRFQGGDLVVGTHRRGAFLGHGFRSSALAAGEIERFLDLEVVPVELRDPDLAHLDLALGILSDGTVLACRDAFTESSWARIHRAPFVREVIAVSRTSALLFGLNWVEINGRVILGSDVPEVAARLRERGREAIVAPLSRFQAVGGSAACLAAPIHDLRAVEAFGLSARLACQHAEPMVQSA